ncbi:MAG: tRNA (adenosine(37)-N6)-threonylcarbamoyltransferase complex ATPase subunit type 1 TsaE [Planctomycetia bacterium]|nr:tRNA (adenosine(37)-N6)-threonylcarbamoyltransferase complex ATPase subunit type 1 TsaE [Planctomycetia bacterium]
MILSLATPEATADFGRRLGRNLFAGAVIGLIGGLGAGKTLLTRAIADGLEVADLGVVSSPTFVLLQEYQGRLPLYHFDVYRLKSPAAFLDLGAAEFLEGDGVCVVEWADLVRAYLPEDRLEISLRATGDESREALLIATGSRHARLLTSALV